MGKCVSIAHFGRSYNRAYISNNDEFLSGKVLQKMCVAVICLVGVAILIGVTYFLSKFVIKEEERNSMEWDDEN